MDQIKVQIVLHLMEQVKFNTDILSHMLLLAFLIVETLTVFLN